MKPEEVLDEFFEEMAESESKSASAPAPIRPEVARFPPALRSGTPLGHAGDLSEVEVEHLRKLGYDPQHYLSATGPRVVELYLEGCLKGLIPYEEKKFKALESARKHYSKVSKTQVEDELVNEGEVDAVAALAHLGSLPVTPPKKRGRPPGKKT